jgi:hypothetical protein
MACSPLQYPQEWDVINIGGVDSPGVCVVGKTKRHNVFDVKRGKGVKGATITYEGDEPASFDVTFTLWRDPKVTSPTDPDDFANWEAFVPLLRYDPSKKTMQAVDIYHPSLVPIDINRVLCEDIGNIVHVGDLKYEVEVRFLEYRPPPPVDVTTTPAGSKATVKKPDADPAAEPEDPAIQKAQNDIAGLSVTAWDPN